MTHPLMDSNGLLDRAVKHVRTGEGLADVTVTVAGLTLPVGGEADAGKTQIEHIVRLLKDYHAKEAVDRPLSIGVFGPPGSGKSRFVRTITKAVDERALVTTVNLTQIVGSEDLARVFADARVLADAIDQAGAHQPASKDVRPRTPVFFFDEFDAARDGVPLGWLSWFLAPMQDGVAVVGATQQKIGKAVFIFAGGTADTLAEFNQRAQLDPESYRARKVPDFVSRLRGSIDIGGVNGLGDARIVPRALALRHFLKDDPTRLSDAQVRQLLSNGHFIHGMRSMETLLAAGWSETHGLDLPDAIRQQHFSRGELDGHRIGISAGLSEDDLGPMLAKLTHHLLCSGATLAYAGSFFPQGTLEQVRNAARNVPAGLVAGDGRPRIRNCLGDPASLRAPKNEPEVDFIPLRTMAADELRDLGAPINQWFEPFPTDPRVAYDPRLHVAWALSLFRLRLRVLQDVSALVVVSGKDDGRSWGRMSGVAEEVMIALALGKPVFVLGGAGGAAHAVGQLLGLDEAPVSLDRCLKPPVFPELDDALRDYASSFEIPGEPDSPKTTADLRRFLFHRGVTTRAWPWNGLQTSENRELFSSPILGDDGAINQATGLILRGLTRIDWKSGG